VQLLIISDGRYQYTTQRVQSVQVTYRGADNASTRSRTRTVIDDAEQTVTKTATATAGTVEVAQPPLHRRRVRTTHVAD